MMKTKIFLLALLANLFTLTASAYDAEIDGIYYNFKGTEATVTFQRYESGTFISDYAGDIIIPQEVTYEDKNYKVTSIGDNAFNDCSNLTFINISNSVTSIGDNAFNDCSNLTFINIPNSVTSIGFRGFYNCTNLASVSIPNSVTSIGSGAFYGTTWYDNQPEGVIYAGKVAYTYKYKGAMPDNTTVNLKEGTIGITEYAFYGCSNLTSISIPNSVTSIGDYAFQGCSGLTSIVIPSGITDISNKVFSGCSSLKSITIPSSVTSIGNSAFSGCSSLASITIPSSVTTIGGSAFNGCSSLTSITIPDGVTSIDSYAFQNCSGLTSITIPDGVTSIDSYAFQNCSGLTSITIPNSVTSIDNYAFQNCTGLTSITIPNSVTSIGTYACLGCSNLKTVHLNSNQIVSKTYSSDSNIRSIFGGQVEEYILGEDVASIGDYTFYGGKIISVTIPESVTSIGGYAFSGCRNLTSVTIPNGVTSIKRQAFYNCSGLTSVISNIRTPYAIGVNVFRGINTSCVLYVRTGTKELYTAQSGWNQFADIIEMAQTIKADDKSREYGEPNPSWTYKVIGDKISGAPSITCSATKTSPAGTYDIVVSKGSVTNTDYSYSNGTLTITKAPLKVSVKNCTRYVGDKNPTFELTYSGFKNGETKAVFTKQPIVTCNATTNSPVGTYTITVSGGAASNYELSYENGTMTIDALFKDNDFSFLLSGREKEVKLLQAPNTETIIVPENATYNGASYPVTQLADNAFASLDQLKCVKIPSSIQLAGNRLFTGCTRLASISWDAPLPMTKEMMGNITNPNLLFYTANTSYAPTGIVNVINSQSKRAERITLADTDGIGDFYCPEEFTASEITYTHTYNQKTERGFCRGWESLALPFDVTEITHETNGVITPFGALEKGYELVNGTKPFWLYEYTTRGAFVEAERIEANVPYIISMPYEARLGIEYILAGNVTFKGTNVTVKATSAAQAVKSGKYSFAPSYENVGSSTAYLLNVGKSYDGNPEGSIFVKGLRKTRPFEAYFELEGSAGVKEYFGVFEHLTDEIRSIAPAMRDGDTEYYQLDGTKRTSPQRGFNIVRTKKGEVHKALIK